MNEDADLLRQYTRDHSESAFAELVERHVNLVYRAAVRQMGGEHRARDVTQQVFTLLAGKAAALAGHPNLPGWLYTTTYRVASQSLRAERRRYVHELEAVAMSPADTTEGSDPMDWNRITPILDAAMHELNPADRDVVLRRFFERRSFAEVGSALQLGEDAARMRVDRALEKLRAALARRGVTSTAGAVAIALSTEAAATAPAGLAAIIAAKASVESSLIAAAGFNLFTLMSTSKIMVGTAALAAFIAVGVALNERKAAGQAAEAAARANQGRESMLRRLQQMERNATAVLPDGPAPDPTPAPAPTSAAVELVIAESAPNPELELVRLKDFQNVGRATPSAAFQTVVWAAVNGKSRILENSFDFPGPARRKLDELWASLTDEERAESGRPERLIALTIMADMPQIERMQMLGHSSEPPDNRVQKNRALEAVAAYGPKASEGFLTNLRIRREAKGSDGAMNINEPAFQMWNDEGEWRMSIAAGMVPRLEQARQLLRPGSAP